MASKRETTRPGAFLVTEEPGAISRDSGYLAEGQNLAAGTLLAADGDDLVAWESGACAGILFAGTNASAARQQVTIIARSATVNFEMLSYGDADEADARDALEAIRIVVIADHAIVSNGGGGGGGYVAKAVEFAINSGMTQDASGLADTSIMSGSMWINYSEDALADGDGLVNIGNARAFISNFHQTESDLLTEYFNTPNAIQICSGPGALSSEIWVNYLWSVNLDFPAGQRLSSLFIGDTDMKTIVNDDVGDPFQFLLNGNSVAIIAPLFPGVIRAADIWITTTHYIDWNDPANRAKVHDANVKPINLGADGSTPFGFQPEWYFSGDSASFATNKGTGGAFILTGTLTNATTSPSD